VPEDGSLSAPAASYAPRRPIANRVDHKLGLLFVYLVATVRVGDLFHAGPAVSEVPNLQHKLNHMYASVPIEGLKS
jgi:hypothetical protein